MPPPFLAFPAFLATIYAPKVPASNLKREQALTSILSIRLLLKLYGNLDDLRGHLEEIHTMRSHISLTLCGFLPRLKGLSPAG